MGYFAVGENDCIFRIETGYVNNIGIVSGF